MIDSTLYSATRRAAGWSPPLDLLEEIFGVACQYMATISQGETLNLGAGSVRCDYAGLHLPVNLFVGQAPPHRVGELLSTLWWIAEGNLRGCAFDSVDGALRVRDLAATRASIDGLKEKRAMALTTDTERAAGLIENARELLHEGQHAAALNELKTALDLTEGKAPVLYALAESLTARAHLANGNRGVGLAVASTAMRLLRAESLHIEAANLEQLMSIAKQVGPFEVLPVQGRISPDGLTGELLSGAAQVAPSNPRLLSALVTLAEYERSHPGPWLPGHFVSLPTESLAAKTLHGAAGGEHSWGVIARWLQSTGVAAVDYEGHTTVLGGRLVDLIERVRATSEAKGLGEYATVDDLLGAPAEEDRVEVREEKERDIMAELKDKMVGAAVSTGTGVVTAFQEGLAIAGSQEVSDRIVKIFHEKLGHNIPMASSPAGQQLERVMIPALVHLIAGMLPDKVPGAGVIQATCMRAITGVAKDDGTALLKMLLPVAGEVLKMSTTEGGLDFAAMMGQTKVEQVVERAIAPSAEVNALSAALAKGLESAEPGEDVEMKVTITKPGKKNGTVRTAEDNGVVPPFKG